MKLTIIVEHITVALLITFNRVLMHDLSGNQCQSTSDSEVCASPPVGVVSSSSSSLALVPYDERTLPVPDFYRDERRLQFGQLTVTISQNWRDVGVAAVVWDAVSTFIGRGHCTGFAL